MNVLFAELVQPLGVCASPQVSGKQRACSALIRGFDDHPADMLTAFAAPVETVEKLLAVAEDAIEFRNAVLRRVRTSDQEARHFEESPFDNDC